MSIRFSVEDLQSKFPDATSGLGFARLGDALLRDGRQEEALSVLQEGVGRHPGYATGLAVLGRCYRELGHLSEAKQVLESALALDPRSTRSLGVLAEVLEQLQFQSDSLDRLQAWTVLDPWDIAAQDQLGRLQVTMGSRSASVPPPPPGLETLPEYSLDDVADFLPKESDALADALPSDMENLTAADFHAGESVQGEDVEARLASLFEGDAASPQTEQPAASASASAATESGELSGDSIYQPPTDEGGITGEPTSIEERVEGNDIAKALDTLFSGEDVGGADASAGQDTTFVPSPEMAGLPGANTDFVEKVSQALSDEPTNQGTESAFLDRREEASESGDEFGAPTSEMETVTGDDIGAKIDSLFGEDADGPLSQPLAADSMDDSSPTAWVETTPAPAAEEPSAFFQETVEAPSEEPASDSLSGEDVAGRLDAFFGEEPDPVAKSEANTQQPAEAVEQSAGADRISDGVTGSDVEDKFDALFGEDAAAPAAEAPEDLGAMPPDDGFDARTLTMPAMDAEAQADPSSETEEDAGRDKDETFFGSADATLILPVESMGEPNKDASDDVVDTVDMAPEKEAPAFDLPGVDLESGLEGFDAPSLPASEMPELEPLQGLDSFETMEIPAAAGSDGFPDLETAFSDQGFVDPSEAEAEQGAAKDARVSGHAVADQDTGTFEAAAEADAGADELLLGAEGETAGASTMDAAQVVSGEDIQDRLSEIFGEEPGDEEAHRRAATASSMISTSPESGAENSPGEFSDLADATQGDFPVGGGADTQGLSRSQVFDFEDMQPADLPDLPPLEDSEPGIEGESEAGDGTAPNVATVTLAEIYFQQGLKEQALQIYRQLLERDPDNEKVRQRVEEIGAAIAEGDAQEGDSSRNPRPGMKVPRRKL